ncbi:MAG: isoleucine--tRNA ligase [Ruminococcaceae bacterium]|nr:isoleucine--tRNA ligase [Oscillospiraceae bacterium]
MADYDKTLNLPKTDFPMRANLPQREPEILEKWQNENLYEKLMELNSEKPLFILHDGPPYANGDMHMGHALNKTLKDIITRFKNMDGFKAPYIHGWDTHGLPIERQAIQKLGINRNEVSISEFRDVCKDFALKYVENQKNQIKRIGSLGDWDDSYLTLAPEFEAKQIEIFGEMAKKGYIYKGLKPIYWCPDCETALAEAEIEYQEDKTNSIYVKFRVTDDNGVFANAGINKDDVYFVIWTTTTWTLPGNVAIAVNPGYDYSLVKTEQGIFVIATELVDGVMAVGGISEYEKIAQFKGQEFDLMKCAHPFIDRESVVIVGEHVTLDAGTGCVHTAPGHGVEDYIACQNYKDIPIIVPVDAKGYLNELAGEFKGLYYEKSNAVILAKLKEIGALYAENEIIHQYPHCWRCHEPIVFRATEQWFASVDDIKDDAVKAIHNVSWLPKWGEDRISAMVSDRNDWCISRQRTWGVPIPIFYCKECGKELINDETIKATADLFREKGSSAWYETDAKDILPSGTKCECGCTEFTKEKDIMDVWFDSGSSHTAVLEVKKGLRFPADLYLEGNDQYRGWFQSSLLTAIATKGEAPYKKVITHGMIVDEEGNKMSKSKGNGVNPQDIIKQYGADILRLWVVSADYKTDMHISQNILKQISEAYRKIRNTARYILGNIHDFNPDTDSVEICDMPEIDRFAMMRLSKLINKVTENYRAYEFHMIYHAIHNFCVVDMSNFYLDVIKDRLYTQKSDGVLRRSAQTVMFNILDALCRMIAPVLCYSAEEIWSFMPHRKEDNPESVMFNDMPKADSSLEDSEFEAKWDKILAIKADVTKALELARAEKIIGHSLNALVTVYADSDTKSFLEAIKEDLVSYFIVSKVSIKDESEATDDAHTGETGIKVSISSAPGEKCERCWMYSETVGTISEHPTLCKRCADVVTE